VRRGTRKHPCRRDPGRCFACPVSSHPEEAMALTFDQKKLLEYAVHGPMVRHLGFWRPAGTEHKLAGVFTPQTMTSLVKRGLMEKPTKNLATITNAGRAAIEDHR